MESIEKDKLKVFISEQEIKGMSVAEKLHWMQLDIEMERIKMQNRVVVVSIILVAMAASYFLGEF
jgi:hypothetical protein